MRAIRQDTHGSPEVLKEIELPRPVSGVNEILVAVRAVGVNPTDRWNRAQPMSVDRLPPSLAGTSPESSSLIGVLPYRS
ncbi:hypothetical protein ACQEVY_06720 [Streptomyces sp. CA-288835]|uniref:hypothetical protein n=1 Tax=Streptomyces sp. CA-288835 TaxID=3240069 RepID=UPI003D8EA682